MATNNGMARCSHSVSAMWFMADIYSKGIYAFYEFDHIHKSDQGNSQAYTLDCKLNDASVFTIRVDRMAGKKPRVLPHGWVDLLDRYEAFCSRFVVRYLVPPYLLLMRHRLNQNLPLFHTNITESPLIAMFLFKILSFCNSCYSH